MKMKILVTGNNRRIGSDICKHLEAERDYELLKCAASKSALFELTLSEMPDVIIICTSDETENTVKVFDVLNDNERISLIQVIVVANDADRRKFISNTALGRISFLSRPMSPLALYKKLEECEKTIAEKSISSITEFVNPGEPEICPRKHILVVDDDPEQLLMIKEHLREFYKVTLINGGRNLFKVLKRHRIDLILLDYMMPDMDGPDVLKMLRTYPEFADIPVMFLTGMSDKEAVIKLLVELKPQGYILKPSKKSEIVAKIIDILG